MTWLSGFWLPSASAPLSSSRILPSLIVHCLDLASPEESLFHLRSMRRMAHLSYPDSLLASLHSSSFVLSELALSRVSPENDVIHVVKNFSGWRGVNGKMSEGDQGVQL